jgi:ABC-type ATPase with predicted acetyltransferase domain
MPNFNIVKESKYKKTFRNESIKGQFDLNIESIKETFVGNIDIENKDWQIGLIVGSSGSGKSTIASQIFEGNYINNFEYGYESVIDEMPKDKSTEEITKTFNSVGFATVWSWLKPYNVLSNGEKMRVDLARAILSDNNLIVFDEFTSVVDRTIAKTASFAISKAVRKLNKQFVAVACHYDIIDWLEPDWIYNTDEKRFFFALKNINDQKSNLKYLNVLQKNGVYLKNIII